MPKKDIKITNLFKEKKKYKRQNIKNSDGHDSSEEKLLQYETYENNKKLKFDGSKFAKITKDIMNDNESKSTIDTSKKTIFDYNEEINNTKEKKIFDLSSHTKKIINKIMSKKKREKENQISNKENDSSLLLLPHKNYKKSLLLNNKENNNIIDSFFKKNDINKKSPPKLSLTTIEIMKKIKQDRKNRFDRPENTDKNFRSESSFSTLKLKYDELLSKSRELRLPIKYKQIMNMFNSLEQAINLNKISLKNNLNTFDNIKTNVEYITGHSFNLTHLQQILYIVPHFYILKYVEKKNQKTFQVNNSLNKDYDLLIDIPKDHKQRISTDYPSDFNFLTINYYKENDDNFSPEYNSLSVKETKQRKEIFRNILNRIVNIYHKEYLKKNNITIHFDPLIQKTWYHSFDPDIECKDIPVFEIPQPPNKISVFENIIVKNDLKNQILKDALSLIKKDNENSNLSNNNTASSINVSKYVSKSFLEKIRAKEKANAVINEIQNYNSYFNNKKDYNSIYKEVLMQMKTILLVNNKSQKIGNLAEMLVNSSKIIKETFHDKEKMEEIIEKISEKFKEFISVKKHSFLGRIVVLENDEFCIPNEISIGN